MAPLDLSASSFFLCSTASPFSSSTSLRSTTSVPATGGESFHLEDTILLWGSMFGDMGKTEPVGQGGEPLPPSLTPLLFAGLPEKGSKLFYFGYRDGSKGFSDLRRLFFRPQTYVGQSRRAPDFWVIWVVAPSTSVSCSHCSSYDPIGSRIPLTMHK